MRVDETSMNSFWWRRAPIAIGRVSTAVFSFLVDGIYLTAWPRVGAVVPAVACVLGLALGWGWLRTSDQITFSYSMPVMVLMAAVGHLGGAIGGWLTAGYALADFLFFPHAGRNYPTIFATVSQDYLPLLVSYALLGILLMIIPAMASSLRHRTVSPLRLPRTVRLVVGAALQTTIQAILVYFWVLAAPMLIRPVFTFRHLGTPTAAFYPLQHNQAALIVTTVVLGIVRSLLEAWALAEPARAGRVAQSLSALAVASTSRSRPLSPWATVPASALSITFLLMGFLSSWRQAFVVALILTLIILARDVLIAQRLTAWMVIIYRLPALVRFAGGILISYFLVRAILAGMWREAGNSMRPGLIGIVLSLAIFAMLFPRDVFRRGRPGVTRARPGAIVGLLLAILLLGASPAYAHDCSTITDCIPSFVWALLGIIAVVLILVVVFFFVIIPAFFSGVPDWISGSIRRSGGPAGEAGGAGEAGAGGATAGGTATGETAAGGAARGGALTAEELAAQAAARRTMIEEAGLAYDEVAAAGEELAAEERTRSIVQASARDVIDSVERYGVQAAEDLVRSTIQQWGPEGMSEIATEMEQILARGGSGEISASTARIVLGIIRTALQG